MKIVEPFINADIGDIVVVKTELNEFEMHDDGDSEGKQVHCPTLDVISCKHEHDLFVQFIVKQPTKYHNYLINLVFYRHENNFLLEIQLIKLTVVLCIL